MDQNIKNRLVGIVVIFALAVIFLPMILDGSGVRKDDFDIVIPAQPETSTDSEFDARIIELNSRVQSVPKLEQHFVDEASSDNQVVRGSSVAKVTDTPDAASEPEPQVKPKPKPKPP